MPIRITVVDGGLPYRFADAHPMVTIGRHPSCDVVLPVGLTAVARHHLAFERKLGRYRLVIGPDDPVWVDGEAAFEDDELPAGVVRVTLGSPDGPALLVEVNEEADGLPATERRPRHDSPHHDSPGRAAEMAMRRSRAVRRMALGLALALTAVVVALGWMRHSDRQQLARLTAEAYGGPSAQAEEALAARLREAAPSVYLVAAKDELGITPVGTAFVVDRGVLVTTAHVAELFAQMGSGLTMVVRGTGGAQRDVAIAAITMHPHYRKFEATWRAYGPLAAGAGGENRPITEAGGYDVALLTVAPDDADALAPPLPLAARSDLVALEPGNLVGYVGFPMESAALGGVNRDNPEAQLQIGRLTALTDFFLVKSDPAERHLLQHSLPVQGGASGSPLFDRRGAVVGIVSGGNLVEIDARGTRVPTGIGVNFGQRADLVRELLAGEAESRSAEREASWASRLKRYQNEVDVALADWAGSHGATMPPVPLFQADGRTEDNFRFEMAAFVHTYALPKAGWYLFLATAPARANIDMMLIEETAKGPRLVGIDSAPDHYPGIEYAGDKGEELEVVVPGAKGTEIYLRIYWLPARR